MSGDTEVKKLVALGPTTAVNNSLQIKQLTIRMYYINEWSLPRLPTVMCIVTV